MTASKKKSKSEGSHHVGWGPTSCGPDTNATRHKRATRANATGADDSPGPTPGLQQRPVCSPPAAAVEWPFGDFEFGAVCSTIKKPHPYITRANSLNSKSSEIGRQTKDTVRLSSPGRSPSPPLRQPVSTLEEAGLHGFEASSYPLKPSLCPACGAVSHVTPSVYRPIPGSRGGRHRFNAWSPARPSSQKLVVRETSPG